MRTTDSTPGFWLREYAPRLLLYARQWAKSDAGAEDIFQDAFIKFWQNRNGVRDPLPYLYRCVRTTAMNYHRSRERRTKHEQQSNQFGEHERPDQAAEKSERQARIQQAVAELPEDQREVVVMKIWGEMTFGQIGEVMSIPRSSAHATYRRAMDVLHQRLGEEGE